MGLLAEKRKSNTDQNELRKLLETIFCLKYNPNLKIATFLDALNILNKSYDNFGPICIQIIPDVFANGVHTICMVILGKLI